MISAAATRGDITIKNVIPKHLESITAKLIEMGVVVEEGDDSVRVTVDGELKGVNIKTTPYPGFPTDIQQPMSSLLSTVPGRSKINESIYEIIKHKDEIERLENEEIGGFRGLIEGHEGYSAKKYFNTLALKII